MQNMIGTACNSWIPQAILKALNFVYAENCNYYIIQYSYYKFLKVSSNSSTGSSKQCSGSESTRSTPFFGLPDPDPFVIMQK
jgi:hypothetical protein